MKTVNRQRVFGRKKDGQVHRAFNTRGFTSIWFAALGLFARAAWQVLP